MQALEDRFDELVRPLLAADGGNIEIVEVTEDTVRVRLTGTCSGCPGLVFTRRHVIDPVVRDVCGPRTQLVVELSTRMARLNKEAYSGT